LAALLQLVLCALLFTSMLTTHLVHCERDCHDEKTKVIYDCDEELEIPGPYMPPRPSCIRTVKKSDMECICHILSPEDEKTVSAYKMLRLARDCGMTVGRTCGSFGHPPPPHAPRTPP
ncbi:hypothetical protein BS78_02G032500, partial [Paspalum vaginatum]